VTNIYYQKTSSGLVTPHVQARLLTLTLVLWPWHDLPDTWVNEKKADAWRKATRISPATAEDSDRMSSRDEPSAGHTHGNACGWVAQTPQFRLVYVTDSTWWTSQYNLSVCVLHVGAYRRMLSHAADVWMSECLQVTSPPGRDVSCVYVCVVPHVGLDSGP